jgi:hypothetical protein
VIASGKTLIVFDFDGTIESADTEMGADDAGTRASADTAIGTDDAGTIESGGTLIAPFVATAHIGAENITIPASTKGASLKQSFTQTP